MPGISFTVSQDWLPDDAFWPAVDDLLDILKGLTPVDTGLAQSNWEYRQVSGGAEFYNDTPYVSYLDEGWSDQAPNGMTEPALDNFPSIIKAYYNEYVSNNPDFQPLYE